MDILTACGTFMRTENILECGCRTVQELFDKLMKLTQAARDDYRRLALMSSVVQHTSNVSQTCVEQFPDHKADQDIITAQKTCFSRRNGFFIHSSDKNFSTRPINGLQEHIVEKISSLRVKPQTQSSSSNDV